MVLLLAVNEEYDANRRPERFTDHWDLYSFLHIKHIDGCKQLLNSKASLECFDL